jgi:methylmalonyl-CoA/ethylmalonyl-CoA epimerase
MKQFIDGHAIQSAWVVDDLLQATLHWNQCGVGPFFVSEYGPEVFERSTYRGLSAPISMKTALAQAGDIQIELIEPLGDFPNIYRDIVPVGKTGFHHICFWTQDIDADIRNYCNRGFEIASSGQVGPEGAKFAYLDTSQTLGHMTELLTYSRSLADAFEQISEAASNWDGSQPIRQLR